MPTKNPRIRTAPLDPELHTALAIEAQALGVSLGAYLLELALEARQARQRPAPSIRLVFATAIETA